MKNRVILLVLTVVFSLTTFAQHAVTVEAKNDEISDNLDLKALGIIFGKARNLEEFEQMINDWRNPISNLDLNYDGEVDYLRVLESREKKTHIIIVQAVLAEDIYQDVATIIATKQRNKPVIQIVGDPYIYGVNYIVEPVYIYTPVIYNWFWGPTYVRWYSPYYWGYYPSYYRSYYCVSYNDYHYYMRGYYREYHYVSYRYADRPRYDYRESRTYNNMSRRDYNTRYPDRSFSSRNSSRSEIVNRRDIDNIRRADDATDRSDSRQSSSYRSSDRDLRTNDRNTNVRTRESNTTDRIISTDRRTNTIVNDRISEGRDNNSNSSDRRITIEDNTRNGSNRNSSNRDRVVSNDRTRDNNSNSSDRRITIEDNTRNGSN
ncbi:MAG: hypothetical protein Q4A56_00195, partial [Porphyromonadaceae bacterium]|nr:hypothetical protein [Porphyromonadaceae bacterium]